MHIYVKTTLTTLIKLNYAWVKLLKRTETYIYYIYIYIYIYIYRSIYLIYLSIRYIDIYLGSLVFSLVF